MTADANHYCVACYHDCDVRHDADHHHRHRRSDDHICYHHGGHSDRGGHARNGHNTDPFDLDIRLKTHNHMVGRSFHLRNRPQETVPIAKPNEAQSSLSGPYLKFNALFANNTPFRQFNVKLVSGL